KSATLKPGADVKRYGIASDDAGGPAKRRSFGLFAVLGLALLAFGALAFFFTRDEAPMAASEPRSAPPVRSASVEPPPLQNVEVHVRTAVDDAQLFVDGEDLGPITPDEDVILEVVPG